MIYEVCHKRRLGMSLTDTESDNKWRYFS